MFTSDPQLSIYSYYDNDRPIELPLFILNESIQGKAYLCG